MLSAGKILKQKIVLKRGDCLSYVDYGDQNGYPVLIQHGLIASIDDYALFDWLIRSSARLICIARPGYGESSPYEMANFAEWGDFVLPLIEELGLAQFDVLGISSGAPYSYALGYRFPDKVRDIFILSGIPALYDDAVMSDWPYEAPKNRTFADLQVLAHELFFSSLSMDDLQHNDIRDSIMHNCFGVAQDLRLRFMNWGFRLSDVRTKVYMRHSKSDESVPFQTAVRTSQLLPDCELELTETGPHFSKETLDDFIKGTMIGKMRLASAP